MDREETAGRYLTRRFFGDHSRGFTGLDAARLPTAKKAEQMRQFGPVLSAALQFAEVPA
jgi:hypothetical protein